MTAAQTSRPIDQFVRGMVLSLMLSMVTIPLGFGILFVTQFLWLKPPIALLALLLAPAAVITYFYVKDSPARLLGAIAFYPCAAAVVGLLYVQTARIKEWQATNSEYAGRTIAQPLGTIDVLGIPLAYQGCHDDCARILLYGVATEVAGISYDATIDFNRVDRSGKVGPPWIFRRFRLNHDRDAGCLSPNRRMSWRPVGSLRADDCIVTSIGDSKLGDMILIRAKGAAAERTLVQL